MFNKSKIIPFLTIFLLTISPLQGGRAVAYTSTLVDRVTVTNVTEFNSAIVSIADGGTIEMAANTYIAPTGGFNLSNLQKSFTIQAAAGADVRLDGNGHEVLKVMNSSFDSSKEITFNNLTIQNGKSNQGHIAGGITLSRAQAIFINTNFVNNSNSNMQAGGG